MSQGFFVGNSAFLLSKRHRETDAQGCDGLKRKAAGGFCQTGIEYVSDNEASGTGRQRVDQLGLLRLGWRLYNCSITMTQLSSCEPGRLSKTKRRRC